MEQGNSAFERRLNRGGARIGEADRAEFFGRLAGRLVGESGDWPQGQTKGEGHADCQGHHGSFREFISFDRCRTIFFGSPLPDSVSTNLPVRSTT